VMAFAMVTLPLACSDAPGDSALRASSSRATVLGRVSGTGDSGLRVREQPTTASTQLGTLAEGELVSIGCQIEGEIIDGNAMWDYLEDEGGYVADAFIDSGGREIARCDALEAPAPPPSSGGSGAVEIQGPPVRPHVQLFVDEACRRVSACRASTYEGHQPSADLAVDFPTGEDYGKVPTDGHAFGDRLAEFAVESRAAYRITYVIYRQRINLGSGWEPMEDRGSVTANHYDHVHVSFDP
jgi:hypothetical protein